MKHPSNKIGYANEIKPNLLVQLVSFILLVAFAIGLIISWTNTLIGLMGTIAMISVIYAAIRLTACIAPKPKLEKSEPIEEWPFYTVLVPLFRESNMVPQLMSALSMLDYPKDKLEIFMICEAIDLPTIEAVRKRVGGIFHLIVVPRGTPQTKPRALNFAMQNARGEFVTIYDAEDIPAPDQLKAAIRAFKADETLGALQAPLDYANANTNWLTRQFGLEYAALFHVWIPFLSIMNFPYPLGGTSNHMRRTALDEIQGWDSHNVTEDADLSFRLAAHKWRLGYITPPTKEEAVSKFKSWHYQRSRWMKGYIQTWQCHMHAPFAPGGLKGLARFFTLQLTVGLTLMSALFHLPVMLCVVAYALYHYVAFGALSISIPFLISLAISYGAGMLIGAVGAIRSGKPILLLSVPFMPLYWLALCAPTLHAFLEVRSNPFHWHKTEHGVSGAAPLKTQSEGLTNQNVHI